MNLALARRYVVARIADTPSVSTIFGGDEHIYSGRAPRNVTRDHITVEAGGSSLDSYALGAPRVKSDPLLIVSFWTCVPSDSIYSEAFIAAVRAADGLLDFYATPETFTEGSVNSCRRESTTEMEEPAGSDGMKWVRVVCFYRFCIEEDEPPV